MTQTKLWHRLRSLPGIRHVRWVYWSYRLTRYVTFWQDEVYLDVALEDLEHLYAILEGRA
jgi:hypothetical protein